MITTQDSVYEMPGSSRLAGASGGPAGESLPSITELPNPLTHNLDLADPNGLVRLFRQTDAQIVNGWRDYPALADREMLDLLSSTVDRIIEVLDKPGKARLVLAGAGTSGRLAKLAAREINRFLKDRGRQPNAVYCMAGGAGALIRAEEGAEDLPARGAQDLEAAIGDGENVVYIGITCGMSAAYIAGQLDWIIDRPNSLAILLGFTTLQRSRSTPIEGWDGRSFRDIAQQLDNDPRHVVMTPIVGPEGVTGSTRMKSGTATGIVLQLLMFSALARFGVLKEEEKELFDYGEERVIDSLRHFLLQYETARSSAYLQSDHLAELIEMGGAALRKKRHIYYIGSGNPGILGLIDASECPPTFGASFSDVRGFLEGGWNTILEETEQAPEPTSELDKSLFAFDLTDFEASHLPDLTPDDLVIALCSGQPSDKVRALLAAAREKGAKLGAIILQPNLGEDRLDVDTFVPLELPIPGFSPNGQGFAEMGLKLLLNDITTGSHILAGKVYRNFMIDLRITNSKLYTRAQRIVSRLMEVSNHHAEAALLSAIYRSDNISPDLFNRPISEHVAVAAPQDGIVPKAMLLATGRFHLADAEQAVQREPVIRQLIDQITPAENK